MASVHVFRRKRKTRTGEVITDKVYSAQIRDHRTGYATIRSTGKTNERDALIEGRRLAKEIEARVLPKLGTDVLTVGRMFARWIIEYGHELRSKKDIKWQIERITASLGEDMEVDAISNATINGFVIAQKQKGAGPATINRCLETCRAVMNYAALRWEAPIRVINWRQFRQKEARIREVYLSPDEARRLMELLPEHIAAAFAFSLYTGMRLNELETLTWERIDFDRLACAVETKGGGERTVWLSQKAAAVLARMDRKASGRVFDLKNRRRHWERARKAIGRTDVHWHDIRALTATYARQFAKSDLRLISRALGHSDSKVTERYARVVDREIVTMLDQLPDISAYAPLHGMQSKLTSRSASVEGEPLDADV